MNRYFEFIASLPKTPGFREMLPVLIGFQILIGILNSFPKLFILTLLLSLCFSGFWVEYLSNAIKCDECAFRGFRNNIIKFTSMGFRFAFVNLLYTLPFLILSTVILMVGGGFIKNSVQEGEISTLILKIIFVIAISLLCLCFAFYILPLVSMRFAVTKSVGKTLNIKRIYVLWHKSKNIYRKMFEDIVAVSTILFLGVIAVLFLPFILISGSFATIAVERANPLALMATSGSSLGMGLVLGISLYVLIALVTIFSTMAIYKIIATYYRVPPKPVASETAEVS